MDKATPGNLHSAGVLFRAFAALLAPLVAKELRSQPNEDDNGDRWVDQTTSPLGKRAHCRACAEGKIAGAYKLKRRWLAKRSALDAFIAANGAAAPSTPVAPANDTDEPTAEDIARVLAGAGLTFAPRRARAAR